MPQPQASKPPAFIPDAAPGFIPDSGDTPALSSNKTLPPLKVTPEESADMFRAGVHSKMLGISPGQAYENRDEIDKQLRTNGGDYDGKLDDTFLNDVKVGYENSIVGLYRRQKMPNEVRSRGGLSSLVDGFVSGVSEMVANAPFIWAGGAAGKYVGGLVGGVAGSEEPGAGNVAGAAIGSSIGGGMGAFALPAVVRQALVLHIQKGNVKDFKDLMYRTADIYWEGAKGATIGALTELAGGIPVAKFASKIPLGPQMMKGLYQALTITTAGDLLNGRIPNAKEFAGSAALILPLNLITHGTPLRGEDAETATQDVYAKSGKTPQETAETLKAQPPVKPDLPPGLTPAIQGPEGVIEANEGESHADVAERVLAKKPVTMEQLEADPAKADDVLQNPQIHEQEVIDRAWQLKKEAVEAGDVEAPEGGEKPQTIEDLYDRGTMKSGRGFVTPDGQFKTRLEARAWMKENEPDVHDMWTQVTGDKSAELHSEDYGVARMRVQNRNMAEGDPTIANVSPQNASRLGALRDGLNKIKAGLASKGYGKEVLRTLFVGQRDTRIAATTQLRDSLAKLIPDYRDQEALSILRDYKGTPDKLAAEAERIRTEGTDREKALLPSIERAMNPSPALLEADKRLTGYYAQALAEGRQLGFMESRIDPANYSPHILTRILDGEKPSGSGKAVMTQRTPFANAREYPTILDALRTGNLDARTVNALDALSVYGDRHATVVATKLLATELKNTELGKYGSQDNHPEGWVELAPGQSAFRSTRAITDAETGEPHVISQALYVPKEVAAALKPMFESGLKGTSLSPLLKAQGYVKALELGLSFFHMKALSITAFNNQSLADFGRSLISDTKSPEFAQAEREWAADGLTTAKTTTPYEAYKGLEKSSVPTGFDKLANAPIIKQVDAAFKWTTHETFDVIQRKFKVQDAELKGASWLGKHPDATPEEYFAARRSIAKEVNAAYGGLNWDVLGTGKTVRDVSRLFLLAPDWTFSNVLNAKYAFEGGPAGSAARMFWAKSFTTGIAMTAATSIAIGGKYNPDAKHFDQVYLGKDKEGKEMYANWFFAGAPKDAMTLVKRTINDGPIGGAAEFVVSKASPLLGIIASEAENKQPTGAPIYRKSDSAGKKALEQAEYAAGRVVPITGESAVETVTRALKDPNHHYSYTDLLELAADSLGSPTQHQGPPQGKPTTPGKPAKARGGKNRFSIRSGR